VDSANRRVDVQFGWTRPLHERPWLGTLVGLAAVICVLVPFALVDPTPHFGLPGALATAVVIFVAVTVGLLPGLITAAGGGVFFVVFVADPVHSFSAPEVVATAVIWVGIAFVAGSVASGLRRRLTATFDEVQTRGLRLQATLESTAAAVGLFTGPDLRCEGANGALRALFAARDWNGAPLHDLLPALPADLLPELRSCRLGRNARVTRSEVRLTEADEGSGRVFSLDGRCRTLSDQPVVYLTLTDVTAAAKLRHDIDRVHAIFRGLALGAGPVEIATALCREAIGLFGCSITSFWTVDGDHVRLMARAPAPVADDRWRLDEMADLGDVVRTGRPLFVDDVHAHYSADRPGHQPTRLERFFRERGYHSLLSLPVAYGSQIGALLFFAWTEPIERPDEELLAVAHRFADEAAIAIERAERLAAEREAARLHRRLEQSLLPKMAAHSERLAVAYRYVPGESRLLIGGDFIDAVGGPDGGLSFVVGDVTGHGPDGAALGSMLRAAWGALAREGVPPAEMLARLDELLIAERSDDAQFATACLARVVAGERELELALAGHPAPLLVTASGATEVEAPHGEPLGVADEPVWRQTTIALPERWTLLAYTDGLSEAMNFEDVAFGRQRIERAGLTAVAAGYNAEGIVKHMLWEMRRHTGLQTGGDDLTMVAVKVL